MNTPFAEYAFDLRLQAVIRVRTNSEEEARKIATTLDAETPQNLTPDGNHRWMLTEFSVIPETVELFEVKTPGPAHTGLTTTKHEDLGKRIQKLRDTYNGLRQIRDYLTNDSYDKNKKPGDGSHGHAGYFSGGWAGTRLAEHLEEIETELADLELKEQVRLFGPKVLLDPANQKEEKRS